MKSETSYQDKTLEQTRLVVESLLQVVPGTQIVAVVTDEKRLIPGFELQPEVAVGAEAAFERITERIRVGLR
jgi:hypothetical protein